MKKIVTSHIKGVLLLSVVWMVLMEKADLQTFVAGLVVGGGATAFTNKVLMDIDFHSKYSLDFRIWVRFLFLLLLEIYKAGIEAFVHIVKGKTQVEILEYNTPLASDFKICLLALAITLTPGTIVVDKQGQKLKILCLNSKEGHKQELVSKKIENLLLEQKEKKVPSREEEADGNL
jgi:multicomponent Na+:H+ antiporter subunit E